MSDTTHYRSFNTELGRLLVAGNDAGLTHLRFYVSYTNPVEPGWREAPGQFSDAVEQLQAYAAQELTEFSLSLEPAGTDFQQSVWSQLQTIPYGETCSYGDIAQGIGNPGGSRAVGSANNSNPIPVIIPCHRVIGANGALVGFGGGLPLKRKLLSLENADCVYQPQGDLFAVNT